VKFVSRERETSESKDPYRKSICPTLCCKMLTFSLLLSRMAELIWDGKYDDGNKRAPVRAS
jgi:hypothetical protein